MEPYSGQGVSQYHNTPQRFNQFQEHTHTGQQEPKMFYNPGQQGHAQFGQQGHAQFGQQGHAQFGQQGHAQFGQQGHAQFGQQGHAQFSQQGHAQFGQQGHTQFGQQGHTQFGQQGHTQFSQQGHTQFSQQGHTQFGQQGHTQYTQYQGQQAVMFNQQLAAPTGQLAAPTGQLAAPTGQLAAPTGQLAAPTGQLAAPTVPVPFHTQTPNLSVPYQSGMYHHSAVSPGMQPPLPPAHLGNTRAFNQKDNPQGSQVGAANEEKERLYRLQQERLKLTRVGDVVRNPLDGLFGRKAPTHGSVGLSTAGTTPSPVSSQPDKGTTVVSAADPPVTQPDDQIKVAMTTPDVPNETKEDAYLTLMASTLGNFKLDSQSMKANQKFKQDSVTVKRVDARRERQFTQSQQARLWTDTEELRSLFGGEEEFGSFAVADSLASGQPTSKKEESSHTTNFAEFPEVNSSVTVPLQTIQVSTVQPSAVPSHPSTSPLYIQEEVSMVPRQSQVTMAPVTMETGNLINVDSQGTGTSITTAVQSAKFTAPLQTQKVSIPGRWLQDVCSLPPVYQEVLQQCDTENSIFLNTKRLSSLLNSSGLSRSVLRDLWNEVNVARPGKLTKEETIQCLGLIALAQKGDLELKKEKLLNLAEAPLPVLQDLPSCSQSASQNLSLHPIPVVSSETSLSSSIPVLPDNDQKTGEPQGQKGHSEAIAPQVKMYRDALVLKNGIAVCNSILQAAYALLLQCSQDVISELVEAPQGWEKVLGFYEIYKLAERLARKLQALTGNSNSGITSVQKYWKGVLECLPHASKEALKTSMIVQKTTSSTIPCIICGCNNSALQYLPTVADGKKLGESFYHVACMNFWNTFM